VLLGVRLYLDGTVSPQVSLLRGRGEVEGRSRIPKPPSIRLSTSSSTSAISSTSVTCSEEGQSTSGNLATTVLDGARFETRVVCMRCATGLRYPVDTPTTCGDAFAIAEEAERLARL
jgi:hypothetical protein